MTTVEYTDQAVEHLDVLQPDIAQRVMDKVDETREFTEHRVEKLS